VDTDDDEIDEIDDGFEISDILTGAGVMQMELVMMNGGLKYHVVDMAVVVVEQT
jgi:hypothetical protein